MARLNRLTARSCATLGDGMHGDGGNLFLRVRENCRTWEFRWKRHGRVRAISLGPLHSRSLAEARILAARMRSAVLHGEDPAPLARPAKPDGTRTFAAFAAQVIEARRAGWRNAKHAAQWANTLRDYANPVFGNKPVDAVTVEDVLRALKPIWTAKPETASRVRQRIEAVLDAAAAQGLRHGENPARWRGHLQHLLPAVGKKTRTRHHPALRFDELPDFWRALAAKPAMSAAALRFAILTAARTGEVIGARWGEIDFARRIWTVPAERMKAKRAHEVPLSDQAIALLQALPRIEGCPYVFPGARGGALSNMAMLELVRGMRPGLTVHGFRSTFRDWAGDCTAHPREVVEAALAHVVPNATEAAYRRGSALQKRRRLMQDWANYCMTQPAS